MPPFELLQISGEAEAQRYPIGAKGLVIGRSQDADVILNQESVSRQHLKLWISGASLEMKYLGSRNGIKVNGERRRDGQLKDGDSLEVGDVIFVVSDAAKSRERPNALTGANGALPALHVSMETKLAQGMSRGEVRFEAATRLSQSLFDLDQLLKLILQTALEWVPAQRAFLMARPGKNGKSAVMAYLSRRGDTDGPPINESVVQFVFEKRSGMMKSLDGSGAAALCAPLTGQAGCVAALYVDSGRQSSRFDTGSLDDLKSLGRIAGLALENAQRHRYVYEQTREVALRDLAVVLAESTRESVASVHAAANAIEKEIESGDLARVSHLWPLLGRTITNAELLVENMLSYARVRPIERTTLDLNELVEKAVAAVRTRAERLGITIKTDLEDAVSIFADGREVYLIILNLLSNAIDAYGRKQGAVTIGTSNESLSCALIVSDQAGGMDPERARDLVQGAFPRKGETDLRLVTTFRVAREMGGDITLRTETGMGSTFTVVLPRPSAG